MCVAHGVMIVIEKLLFSKIENKVELLPLSKHWTLLSCEESGDKEKRGGEIRGGRGWGWKREGSEGGKRRERGGWRQRRGDGQ